MKRRSHGAATRRDQDVALDSSQLRPRSTSSRNSTSSRGSMTLLFRHWSLPGRNASRRQSETSVALGIRTTTRMLHKYQACSVLEWTSSQYPRWQTSRVSTYQQHLLRLSERVTPYRLRPSSPTQWTT